MAEYNCISRVQSIQKISLIPKSFFIFFALILISLPNAIDETGEVNGCIGLSNNQIDRVHQGLLNSYDFKVDTTAISSFEAARLILKFVDDTPAPGAFLSLGKQNRL